MKFCRGSGILSKYRRKKLKIKSISINEINYNYYGNVLITLGLSKFFVLYNNYYYFGKKNLKNQDDIKEKFKNIEDNFENFLDHIYRKYNSETTILEFGTIYSKLKKIYLSNDEFLDKEINNLELINDISYHSKVADLMSRKIKTYIEIAIINDNQKSNFVFSNSDYRKLVILLYYYSLFIFYNSRSNLSRNYENGVTNFYIYPWSLKPICTTIIERENKDYEIKPRFNYNSKIEKEINSDFNNAFFEEKGITYTDFKNLLESLIKTLNLRKNINGRIEKSKFLEILNDNYHTINIEKFKSECILNKDSFDVDRDQLYKNNSKHRLDTVPLVEFDSKYYILNEGFLWNSNNFWYNVHSFGLPPYKKDYGGKILKSLEVIVDNISSLFEKDVIKIFLKINKNMKIYNNKKTKDIFKNKNIDNNEWDIIAIDHTNKHIYDVEVKFLSTSITESGLANDLEKIIGKNSKSYKEKFEKRIDIENNNKHAFLTFCKADESYKIVHIMVTSKLLDLNVESDTRKFLIIHYDGLEQYILKKIIKK